MKRTRVTALVLAACMVGALLTGCGGEKISSLLIHYNIFARTILAEMKILPTTAQSLSDRIHRQTGLQKQADAVQWGQDHPCSTT